MNFRVRELISVENFLQISYNFFSSTCRIRNVPSLKIRKFDEAGNELVAGKAWKSLDQSEERMEHLSL